ncbi:MAG: nucleotidyltransferase domain-containing protein [Nitrospiria bacterium]
MKAENHKSITKKIVNTIVESVYPEKVILFGSRAKGNYRKDSDYDFIIIKSGVKNEREVSRRIYRALFDNNIRIAVDIIVVDSDKLEKNKDNPYLIYSWALKEGEIVYG